MKAHIEDIEDTHICRVLLSIYYLILYRNNFPMFFQGEASDVPARVGIIVWETLFMCFEFFGQSKSNAVAAQFRSRFVSPWSRPLPFQTGKAVKWITQGRSGPRSNSSHRHEFFQTMTLKFS